MFRLIGPITTRVTGLAMGANIRHCTTASDAGVAAPDTGSDGPSYPTMSEEMPRLRAKIPRPSNEEDRKDFGWLYADLDSAGKTAIDRMYDGQHESVMKALLRPIPTVDEDGCVRPDFAVGLQQYHHSLRGAYREAIAKALGVAPQQVRLSVAWSARYDVKSFFKGVRKVVGVTLISATNPSRRLLGSSSGHGDESGDNAPEIRNTHSDFDMWRQNISTFVRNVKSLNRSDLVALHITQATSAVNETTDVTNATTLVMESSTWSLPPEVDRDLFTDAVVEATICLREAIRIYTGVIMHDSHNEFAVGVANPTLISDNNGSLQKVVEFVIPVWKHQLQKCHVIPAVIDINNLAGSLSSLHIGFDPSKMEKLNQASRQVGKHRFVARLLASKVVFDVSNSKVGVSSRSDGPMPHQPLMFINGAFVGGVSEMAYLAQNMKAFRTMVLHPDDIEIKAHLLRKVTGARNKLVTRAEHMNMTHH